ncbi:MAG: MoxR family ATPase [Candidatus Yanofskybacteria bacterium]|nr:MoxR family ATPase [Candidatus Yanofskybacteria bacterium]
MDPITPKRIREIEQNLLAETTKWLFGLEEPARMIVRALFTLIPYSDKITKTKLLGQPNIMMYGGTGVGKTDLIESVASAITAKSSRVQGTPDLMPYDILGHPEMIETKGGERKIVFCPGPICAHIVKVDEGNRMRGQTWASLLEAMEEHSISPKVEHFGELAKQMSAIPLFPLSHNFEDIEGPRFFMTLITQNIFGEEEGTYENPMAELDRVTLAIFMKRPSPTNEVRISADNVVGKSINQITTLEEILACAHYIFENVKSHPFATEYRVRLLRNTDPETVEGKSSFRQYVKEHIRVGATPRVNFHFEGVARTQAFFDGNNEIRPEHFKKIAKPVIMHRLRLTPGKEFKVSKDEVFEEILENTMVPKW